MAAWMIALWDQEQQQFCDEMFAHIEDDLRAGAFEVPTICCEDPIVHTALRPFCEDPDCPCHDDEVLYSECCIKPWLEGLLTREERARLVSGKQIITKSV
jgi:hypothetical protein